MINEYLKTLIKNPNVYSRAVERFNLYRDLLIEWNNKFNLTAITDPKEIEVKHFIDSLVGNPYIKGSVLDIGTGAGFPSIPLAIINENCSFMMADSLNKRILFLNEVIERLEISNAKCIHSRAEDLNKKVLYDTVVARAVAPLNILAEYSLPFVKVGGLFVAYKSYEIEEEINSSKNAIKILGGKIEDIKEVEIYSSDIIRKLVLIRKIEKMSEIYPRNGNKPKLHPLC